MDYTAGRASTASRADKSRIALVTLAVVGIVLLLTLGGSAVGVYFAYTSALAAARGAAQANIGNVSFRPSPILQSRLDNRPISTTQDALAALRDESSGRKKKAAEYLQGAPVESAEQSAVAAELAKVVEGNDRWTAESAMRALDRWGSANEAPAVLRAMNGNKVSPALAIPFLGRMKYAPAAESIAGHLNARGAEGDAAKEALVQIGPSAAPFVKSYVVGGDSPAEQRAIELLIAYGENVGELVLDNFLTKLKNGGAFEKRDVAAKLALLEVVPARRREVAAALEAALSDHFAKGSAMQALAVWGDEASLPALVEAAKRDADLRGPALDFIAKHDPDRAGEVWASLLADFRSGDTAADKLIEIGPGAEDYVLPYFNSPDQRARERAWRVLESYGTKEDKLLTQSALDLKSSERDRPVTAAIWLKDAAVDESRRAAVAAGLADMYETVFFTHKKTVAEALSRWATKSEIDALVAMLDEHDQGIWEPALGGLVRLGEVEKTKYKVAENFEHFAYGAKWAEAMRQIGPAAEPLAIALLQHSSGRVVIGACSVLAAVGTQDCLRPISQTVSNWRSDRSVVQALNAARDLVLKRKPDEEPR